MSSADLAPDLPPDVPRHGYQGDRTPAPSDRLPAALTVAVSREAGARGGSIARRAGRLLGWQVYDSELLAYLARPGPARDELLADLPEASDRWVGARLEELRRRSALPSGGGAEERARLILTLGATGGVVMVGRGAGHLLPRHSTLHVRVVAPAEDRVAYMSQLLRLTRDEAAAEVRRRDERRAEFVGEMTCYDLVINSRGLGEELAADLIVRAARARQ